MSDNNNSDAPQAVGLTDYIAAMKKNTFTQNWDVAVTYDHKKINDLLAKRFAKGGHGMAAEVKLSINTEDRKGSYIQWYQFTLGPPLIQFESSLNTPTCSLETVIKGGKIWNTAIGKESPREDERDLAENGYKITISKIDLGSVSGETPKLNSGEAPEISRGNDLVVFPDEGDHSSHIVMDFPTSQDLTARITYNFSDDPPFAMKERLLLTALEEFFRNKVSAIHYTLAIVNNATPPDGSTELVPKSFRFATMRISDTKSYLTMFIQTRSSTKQGNTTNLQSRWITDWTDAKVHPIPTDNSATIIINNSFFVETFISPVFGRYKATVKGIDTLAEQDGIRLEGQWPELTRAEVVWKGYKKKESVVTMTVSDTVAPEVKFNPNQGGKPIAYHNCTIRDGNDKPAIVSINWSYSFRNTWSVHTLVETPLLNLSNDFHGAFKSTFSLSKQTKLTTLDNQSFTVDAGVENSDWKITLDPEGGDSDGDQLLKGIIGGDIKLGHVPDFLKDATINIVDFKFDFGKLNFFSITNVLLPGQKVIDVNIGSGVRVPRDVVIVGNVLEE